MLLTEFDPAKSAVIDPDLLHAPVPDFPEVTVSCFSRQLFARLLEFFEPVELGVIHDATMLFPIYAVNYRGKRFAFFQSSVGEPACVGNYEEVMAMGSKRLILFGNCGELDPDIEDCGHIIPTAALRDEGCSYHYAPAGDKIAVNGKYRDLFREVLRERGYPWVEGVTWTTDALYRETREKVKRRREQGAVCVEMECAGMQAACGFRGTEFFEFFYAGDSLNHDGWDPRSIHGGTRLDDKEKIGLLAFELGYKILERLERGEAV